VIYLSAGGRSDGSGVPYSISDEIGRRERATLQDDVQTYVSVGVSKLN
jgi:hypothetical protein